MQFFFPFPSSCTYYCPAGRFKEATRVSRIFTPFIFFLGTCVFNKLWWMDNHLFVNVVNFVSTKRSQLTRVKNCFLTTKRFAALICSIYLFMMLVGLSRDFDRIDGNLSGIQLWWHDQIDVVFYVEPKTRPFLLGYCFQCRFKNWNTPLACTQIFKKSYSHA